MVFKTEDVIEYFDFYQFPKALIKDEKLREMSFGAKILYFILMDGLTTSVENNLYDEFGIYQYFTVKELMQELNCSSKTVIKLKKELNEYGLIKEKRQFNSPNKIYVNKIM